MDIDILSPEFIELAEKAKAIHVEKEKKKASFKELWIAHQKEIEDLDRQAGELRNDFFNGPIKSDTKKSKAAAE